MAFHLARFAVGIRRDANNDYWETVAWMRREAPSDAPVPATPVLGLSLPQRSYDFFRALVPYDSAQSPRSPAEVVSAWSLQYVVVDDEWRQYETSAMADFLRTR